MYISGYEMEATGKNPEDAHHSGVRTSRSIWLAMFISGGLLGLSGMSEICGIYYVLQADFPSEYGYTAIPVALLGNLEPIGVFFASILFGALATGLERARLLTNLPTTLSNALQGIILVFILIGHFVSRWKRELLRMKEV